MLTKQEVQKKEIMDACDNYDDNEDQFRKILIKFLQLGPDAEQCQWLAGELQIDPSSVIRATQESYNTYPALRKIIVKTIQNNLLSK